MDLVPVFVDSPMATDATSLLKRHHDDHRLSPDTCAQMCSIATYVRDVDASKELAASRMPKVVISASGMATGGRVLHHLKAFGGDPRNTILFSGFQAAGTRGRAMIEGQREVKIHGDWIDIRAEVADLEMLSAHADANELMRWLSGFRAPPKETLIVHGEPATSQALQQRIHSDLGWKCSIARMGQSHDFGGSAPGQTRHPEALSWDPLTQKGAT
jgi:metallo-beta-lactamase family protein